MIIDFHTHTFPDVIAESALSTLEEKGNIKRAIDGKLSDLLRSMGQNGIDKSVTCPVATKPSQVVSINNVAIKSLSDSRLVPFAAMHPGFENIYDELKRVKDAGIKGIKIHPEYQTSPIDSPEYIRLLQCCRDLDLICLVHAGRDVGFPNTMMCLPSAIKRVLPEVRGLRFVLAHLGGWSLWDEAADLLSDEDIWIDTSLAYHGLGGEHLSRLISRYNPDRILFGTDSPWDNQGQAVRDIRSLGLSDDLTEKIFCKNALSLLRIGNED